MGSHGEVADDFAYLVKALWSGQYRFITPRDFKVSFLYIFRWMDSLSCFLSIFKGLEHI